MSSQSSSTLPVVVVLPAAAAVSPSSSSPPSSSPSSAASPPSSATRRSVGNYIVTKRLGHGSFATVWRGYHRQSGAPVAIKSISRAKLSGHARHVDNLASEIAILQTLQSPHIVQLHDIQHSERHIYLIMEFAAGGDLAQFLRQHKALPLPLVQHFARQLMAGLQLLHSRQLIHRDLKPQNLLLDQCTSPQTAVLKLADFGFARELQAEDLAATLCGSPLYMAPEILRYQPYDGKADLWSVGAIVYEMVVGRPPYTGQNHIHLLQRIDTEEVTFPPALNVSADCRDFILRLLKRRPEERMSFADFFDHPFMSIARQRNNRPDPEELVSGRGDAVSSAAAGEDSASLRLSSTLQPVLKEGEAQPAPAPDVLAATSGRQTDGSSTLLAPSPARVIGRGAVVVGSDDGMDAADRAGIVVASSPPLDIPTASSHGRNPRSSPTLATASTSPPLVADNSTPPSPPADMTVSLTGRSRSGSRSSSFDERLPGARKDSASTSASSRSGSGSGAGESATSERGRTSGLSGSEEYVFVDDQAVANSPSHDNRPAQPASPSFRSSVGKIVSLASSLLCAPPVSGDSPSLPPISEVPYTVQEMEEDGDADRLQRRRASSSSQSSSLLRAAVAPAVSVPPVAAAFKQSMQSVLLDVHLASTIARCADFYRDQAAEQQMQDEPLPITQRLQALMPGGGVVSLQAAALGLYVKALTLLHRCVEFMDGDYQRIMREHRYAVHSQQQQSSSAALAASAAFKNLTWQGVYARLVGLVADYTAVATQCAEALQRSASSEQSTPGTALFEVGARSAAHAEQGPGSLADGGGALVAGGTRTLTSSSASLSTIPAAPDAGSAVLSSPASASSSTILTFASSAAPQRSAPTSVPAVVDPVLSAYYGVREWLSVGLMHEGNGEWSEAELHYRLARTLCDLLREEVNGSGGAGSADADLLNTIAEQLDHRLASVVKEASEQMVKSDDRAVEDAWRAEDEAVYGSVVEV